MPEGNVFSHVCLSFCSLRGRGRGPRGSVQTCSLEEHPRPLDLFKCIHYVAYTSIRKRVVGLRLKCFLVTDVFGLILLNHVQR